MVSQVIPDTFLIVLKDLPGNFPAVNPAGSQVAATMVLGKKFQVKDIKRLTMALSLPRCRCGGNPVTITRAGLS